MRREITRSSAIAWPIRRSSPRMGGPRLPSGWRRSGVSWRRADNKRTAGGGHPGGWDQMRYRLNGYAGYPVIVCATTCVDSIRTIPALQHDEKNPEDLDTNGEDHAADDWRYACMSRFRIEGLPAPPEPVQGMDTMSYERLLELERDRGRLGG